MGGAGANRRPPACNAEEAASRPIASAAAADSTDGDEAAHSVYELLGVADRAGRTRGALLIRQQLHPLTARIATAAPLIHEPARTPANGRTLNG